MTATDPRAAKQSYNDAAIEIAAELIDVLRRPRTSDSPRPARRELRDLVPGHDPTALGVGLEYERMGHQPVTDELVARATAQGIEFEHLGLTIGTVMHGIDLHDAFTEERIALIRATLLERKVIFFRDQHLDVDRQVEFGRCFGELDAFPFGRPGANPFILEIAHGERSPGTENGWHTDVTWMECPSLGSIAQCVVVPPVGGDTLFSDSHAAFLGLPAELQEQIRPLDGINDYRVFLRGRGGRALPAEFAERITERIPFGVTQPLVRTHPETGKEALYIHGGFLRHDSLHDRTTGEQLGAERSQAIVKRLLEQHPRPEYHCRFSWEPGSIAFWDNRAVQHYAASDYWPHDRLLRRVTVSGDRPYYRSADAGA